MNKEAIIICESMYHGNTQRLAKAMAYELNCKVVNSYEASSMDLSPYKIIGLGSGIYFTSHHPRVIDVASRLIPNQKAFIFSTHGSPILGKYHATLKLELIKRGIPVLGEFDSRRFDCTGPFIMIGGGNKGRPNERDEQKSIRFVAKILPEYHKDLSLVPKGSHVHVDNACIACGKCIAVCPMNVFNMKDGRVVVVKDNACIHCSLCQYNCPAQAVSVKHGLIDAVRIAKKHVKKKGLYERQFQ